MAFRHPGQLTAPFNIMSSSAKGGYLTDLHTNFTPFVEINNFHEDLVITDDSVPMQGPFTNRWVGGRQHRHQEIVTGSMLKINRAESLFVIADSNQLKVYGADHPTLHQARAILYRDGVAQRPLNIANIQFGTGSQSIGNYQEIYQVVQTVGRTTNPRDFAENSTAYQAFPERMTHEGDVLNSTLNDTGSLRSYTLPTRSTTKAILVNKFSAPGDRYTMSRGFLNPAGEEMSVYNAMPFRNLPNRTTLRNQLTRHSKQGGYESGSATTPSTHKVARNTKKVPVVINGTETTRQIHDNYFIQHPIPQTDLQYAWITQSVGTIATTSSVLYGYQPDANALKLHTASPFFLNSPVTSSRELDPFGTLREIDFNLDTVNLIAEMTASYQMNLTTLATHYSSVLNTRFIALSAMQSAFVPVFSSVGDSGKYNLLTKLSKTSSYGVPYDMSFHEATASGVVNLIYETTASWKSNIKRFYKRIASFPNGTFSSHQPFLDRPFASIRVDHDNTRQKSVVTAKGGGEDADGSWIVFTGSLTDPNLHLSAKTASFNPWSFNVSDNSTDDNIYINWDMQADSSGNYHLYALDIGNSSTGSFLRHSLSTNGGKTWTTGSAVYSSTKAVGWGTNYLGAVPVMAEEVNQKQYVFVGEPEYDTPEFDVGRLALVTSSANNTWSGTALWSHPGVITVVSGTHQNASITNVDWPFHENQIIKTADAIYYNVSDSGRTTPKVNRFVGRSTNSDFTSYERLAYWNANSPSSSFASIYQGRLQLALNNNSAKRGPNNEKLRVMFWNATPGNAATGRWYDQPLLYWGSKVRKEHSIEQKTNTYSILSSSARQFEKRYNYSTWRQIRKDDPVTKYFKKNNIVAVTTIDVEDKQDGTSKENIKNHHFVEPPITSVYKPLTHTLSLDEGATVGAYDLVSSYGNFLGYYNNEKVNNLLEIAGDEERTFYSKFLESFLLGESSLINNAALKYINKVLHFSYSEQIYPGKERAYLSSVRKREGYKEAPGQGAGGYDRTYGTQRTFYRDSEQRSSTTSLNSMGVDPALVVTDNDTYDFSFTSTNLPSQTFKNDGSIVYLDTSTGEYSMKFTGDTGNTGRFFEINKTFAANTTASLSFEYLIGNNTTVGGQFFEYVDTQTGYNNEFLYVQVKPTGSNSWSNVIHITGSGPNGASYPHDTPTSQFSTVSRGVWNSITVNVWPSSSVSGEPNPNSAYSIRIAQRKASGQDYDNWGIKNVKIAATGSSSEKPASSFWPMRTDGVKSFQESGSYSNNVGELMQDTDESIYGDSPVPSLSYAEVTHIRKNNTSSDYLERLTEESSNKKPFFDSYEQYSEDFRGIAKDMSILPEYNISEHIDSIVGESSQPTSLTGDILSCKGATHTSSIGTSLGLSDGDFFDNYVTTKEMEFHTQETNLSEDHLSYGMGFSTLDIDVTGIKKMRIENGFYPITRTVQLGNILSSSFKNRIKAYEEGVEKTSTNSNKRAMQGLLKPFMSPGILYNSLKSGLAVDYPIYTASAPTVIEGGDNTFGEFNLSTKPDFRLPFDSLYVPSRLPAGDKIRFVSSFVSDNEIALQFPYQFSWDGIFNNSKFELAMHNFLAESVDFFLEEGQLTSFKSKKQSDFADDLDPSKSYYMDVRLSDIEQLNKFVEYSGSKRVVPDPFFSADVVFTDAISGSDAYYACGISTRNMSPSARGASAATNPDLNIYGKEIVSVWKNYLDDAGWQKVQDISLDGLNKNGYISAQYNFDPYRVLPGNGHGSSKTLSTPSTAKLSYGSAGLHLAISDPYFYVDGEPDKYGALHLLKGDEDGFKINSDGTPTSTHYTFITSSHFSDGLQGSRNHFTTSSYGGLCGGSLKMCDDTKGGIYLLSAAPPHPTGSLSNGDSVLANKGILFLFHSKSSGFSITQGTSQNEYQTVLTSSSNSYRGIATASFDWELGSKTSLIDMQYVEFPDDPGNKISGLHIVAGVPSYNSKRGAAYRWLVQDPGLGENKKVHHNAGSIFSTNVSDAGGQQGSSVAIAIDPTGTKKEIYYFTAGDAVDTDSTPHDMEHGRIRLYSSSSTGFHGLQATISASHSTYVTSSGDVKRFVQYRNGFGTANTANAGFGYHIDAEAIFNKTTGRPEIYVAATIPQMSASGMNGTYLTGGLAVMNFYSQSGDYVPRQSVFPIQKTAHNAASDTVGKVPVKLLYGGNPNNPDHNLFVFTGHGAGVASDLGLRTAGLSYYMSAPSGASGDSNPVISSNTSNCIMMFTGALAQSTSVGNLGNQNAVTFANKTISGSTSHQGAFVNKQHGKLFGLGVDRVMDPGYVSYTPPHFYGEAIARIKYKPTTSVKPTIREIFESATVENILLIDEDRVATHSGRKRRYKKLTTTQEKSKMTLSSSLDLFGVTVDPGNTKFDSEGNITSFDLEKGNQDNARWVISTKYESPVLDSRDNDSAYSSKYTSHNTAVESSFNMTSLSYEKPKTQWTNYGTYSEEVLPSLTVRDSFSQGAYGATTGSLVDVVGFEPETKRVSKLAESKTVEEALLILPYIERRNYTTGKSFLDREKFSPIKLTTNSIKRSMKFGESDDGIYRIPDMIADMKKYHLPPRLDFLSYGNKIRQKFAMFFVKVDHTFDREDLSDIWQGLSPKIARNMDGELFEDRLKVSIKDFFGVFGGRPPEGLKFAIFKVKKKAKKNYFRTTADSRDDNNFLVSFAGDAKLRINENRSYNWPYDYFSLLETAKVDATINMSSKVSVDGRTPTITSEDRTRALNTLLGTTTFTSEDIDDTLGEPPELNDAELKRLNDLLSRLPLDSEAAYAKRRRRRIMARIARIRRIRAAGKKKRASRRAMKRKRKRRARRNTKLTNSKRGKITGLGRKSARVLSSISPFRQRMTKRQAKNLKQMVNILGHRFSWSVRGKRK